MKCEQGWDSHSVIHERAVEKPPMELLLFLPPALPACCWFCNSRLGQMGIIGWISERKNHEMYISTFVHLFPHVIFPPTEPTTRLRISRLLAGSLGCTLIPRVSFIAKRDTFGKSTEIGNSVRSLH